MTTPNSTTTPRRVELNEVKSESVSNPQATASSSSSVAGTAIPIVARTIEVKTAVDREVKLDTSSESESEVSIQLEQSASDGSMAAESKTIYDSFCAKHNLPLLSTRRLHSHIGRPKGMKHSQWRDIVIKHNQLLKEWLSLRSPKKHESLRDDVSYAHSQVAVAERQSVKNQQQLKDDFEHFAESVKAQCTARPNVPELHTLAPRLLCAAQASMPDFVTNTSSPSRQPGLAREAVGTYFVVASILRRIAASVSMVLYTEDCPTLARQYSYNILIDCERPAGKEPGTGGLCYSGYVDLGPDFVEIYAVSAVIKSLQSDLLIWRAMPESPIRSSKLSNVVIPFVAALCFGASSVAPHFRKSIADSLGLTVDVLTNCASKKEMVANLHEVFGVKKTWISSIKRLFGLAPESHPTAPTLHIVNNLDLATQSYTAGEFACCLPVGFTLGPLNSAPLAEFHQLRSNQYKVYQGASSSIMLGGPNYLSTFLSMSDKASQLLVRWQQSRASTQPSETKEQCLDLSSRECSSTVGPSTQCQQLATTEPSICCPPTQPQRNSSSPNCHK